MRQRESLIVRNADGRGLPIDQNASKILSIGRNSEGKYLIGGHAKGRLPIGLVICAIVGLSSLSSVEATSPIFPGTLLKVLVIALRKSSRLD